VLREREDIDTTGIRIEHLPPDLGISRVYPKRATIWTPETHISSVYFLRRGHVCIIVRDERCREIIVRLVRPGEPFGLTCFAPAPLDARRTTAQAIVQSEVVEIPSDAFVAFVRNNEPLTRALLATLSERLAYAEERVRIVANHDAEDRLCALLDQLGRRHGRPSGGNPEMLRIHFTHAELAELSGLNRAHVSTVMGRLRDKGVVTYGRNTPLVVNTRALAGRQTPQPEA
jgi:CRP/FNR family transcriptional regulator